MLIRYWIFFVVIHIIMHTSYAQDSCVAYTSIKSYTQNQANKICEWAYVQPLNNNKIVVEDDNEYYFFEPGDKKSLLYILRTYLLIHHNNQWYVNTERLGLGKGFAKVLITGKYWVIKSCSPQINQDNLSLRYNKNNGKFEPLQHTTNARQYMYYAIHSESLAPTPLTFAGMLQLLSPYEALQYQFVKDKRNDHPHIIIAYIKEINSYINFQEQQDKEQRK
jgi:hypothetical protein